MSTGGFRSLLNDVKNSVISEVQEFVSSENTYGTGVVFQLHDLASAANSALAIHSIQSEPYFESTQVSTKWRFHSKMKQCKKSFLAALNAVCWPRNATMLLAVS